MNPEPKTNGPPRAGEKYVCIHGHFYQPPRENPWLEAVEMQESSAPYHDWNERITFECYAPNSSARLLDKEGKISDIVNNYSRMSFNFGPTLLMWLKEKAPGIHQAIVDADIKSRERFSGHGSALAQCYNHIIMPLANPRDKHTQVEWGIRDFESRFGRKPEGMWLPETAADNESLHELAAQDIKFTILSPFQANRIRALKPGATWQDVDGGRIDPSMPYLVKLPSGRSMSVFFYDALIAKAVAFERLLENGEHFAARVMSGFAEGRSHDQLINIATDGESYGHHSHFGDMALAYALHSIENEPNTKLTIYAEFLEKHPPTHEVEIHQGSAWSCSHGVGRWRQDCGCNSGGHAGWNQQWRAPLRDALDWLRDKLAPLYESKAAQFLKDPWGARDRYIEVILNRSEENIAAFFKREAARELSEADQVAALGLLEMQRHALLMFTSCGWFFDEISGIETVQVIQYAARAIQLTGESDSRELEAGFMERLEQAQSNLPEHKNGRVIFEKFVRPAIMTRESVGAHYAISSLFETYSDEARIYSFNVRQQDRQLFSAGSARLAMGRIQVTFSITRRSEIMTYAVVHMGDHNLNCGVRPNGGEDAYRSLVEEARKIFERGDFPELIRLIDKNFGPAHYSLKNLFRDEQQKALKQILAAAQDEMHNAFRLITDHYSPLARFLDDLHAPAVRSLGMAMGFVLNSELRRQFENGHLDVARVKTLVEEGRAAKITFDSPTIAYAAKLYMERLSDEFLKKPEDLDVLQRLTDGVALVRELPIQEVQLWKPQNIYHGMLETTLPEARKRTDEASRTWVNKFLQLGGQLGFRTPEN